MIRSPYFSEVAARHGLADCGFADAAVGPHRYCERVLCLGFDDRPLREFFVYAAIEYAAERDFRLFALDSQQRFQVVAVGCWRLPLPSLRLVLTDDGVVVDFAGRRCWSRDELLSS